MQTLQPKKKLSGTAFAAGVLLRAVQDAALAPVKAEAEERINTWVQTAKARYLERVEGIPVPDAEECATTAFSLNCMTGPATRSRMKLPAEWPDPVVAADEDMARWGATGAAP